MRFLGSLAGMASAFVPGAGPVVVHGKGPGGTFQPDAGGEGFLSGLFPNVSGPARRGTRELLQAYSRDPWLQANTGKLADDVASATWRVYVRRDKRGRALRDFNLQKASHKSRKAVIKELQDAGELEEIPDHPLIQLLTEAHVAPDDIPGLPKLDGWATEFVTQVHMELKGEAFWLLEYNRAGRPSDIWPLPPHWVTELPTMSRPTYKISAGAIHADIPATEVIWFKRPHPLNPYGRGTGRGEALADEIEVDEAAAKHTKMYFLNNARPDLLVGVKNANPSQLKEAKKRWDQENQGFWNRFKAHFYRGELTVTELTQNAKDAQLLELRTWEREVMRQMYGMPPEILGIVENSNRATIEAADDVHARHNLVPRLDFKRRIYQSRLAPLYDDRIIVDYDSPVPEDVDRKLKAMQAQPAAVEANEWRRVQGLDPKPELEGLHLVSLNQMVSPLEELGMPAPAPEGGDEPADEPEEDPDE